MADRLIIQIFSNMIGFLMLNVFKLPSWSMVLGLAYWVGLFSLQVFKKDFNLIIRF